MKRDPISLSLDFGRELIIDNFAGGGGASTGIEMAFGRPVDIAVNHDGEALAMHAANHPTTKHYQEDVFAVHPGFVTNQQPIGLAWFSPDCKHHSKAKGGKPREQKIRGLAWVTLKWATFQSPRCIALENVEEFQDWGPLDDAGKPIKSEKGRTFKAFIAALSTGLDRNHPDVQEIYETLGADFPMERLYAGLGYKAEYRVLRAHQHNTPTIRKRLYVFARRDGLPIRWPTPTHGDPKSAEVKAGKLLPYRTAAECIDWSIPCPSIFERKRPLKDATLRRIAKGIMKFVVNSDDPFIVPIAHYNGRDTAHSGNEPLRTVTASPRGGSLAVVAPTLMHVTHQGSDRNAGPDAPLATVTGANRGEQALVTAFLAQHNKERVGVKAGRPADVPLSTITASGGQQQVVAATLVKQNFGDTPCQDVETPLHTITTQGNKFGVVAATLIQTGYGERAGQAPRVPGLDKPLGTAVAGGVKHALVTAMLVDAAHGEVSPSGVKRWGIGSKSVEARLGTVVASGGNQAVVSAFLAKHYGGHETPGASLDEPASTVTATDHHALVTSSVVKLRGDNIGHAMDEPLHTVSALGMHHGEVRAFLIKYYGEGGQWQDVREPMHTIPTKDRLGLVTIHGEDYAIVDIGMRMLTPRELARAQGFPDSYVLDPLINGKPLSKSAQVRMIGNSVCPPVAAAIIRANFAHEMEMKGVAA